jgi:probable HAF family extracellular repeat protein
MKSRFLMCTTAMTLFAALAIPLRLAAQEQQPMNQLPRYAVIDLGTLGGSLSEGRGINKKGWVTGTAYLPGNTAQHRVLWQMGMKMDLGTLGGPNSGGDGFGGLNDRGQDVGHAETSTPDPLGEDFCGFGTHLICLPFLWQNGTMVPLPTLGGNNGGARAINNRARVVGEAENTMLDSTCPSPELQAEPALWENGTIEQLPTFPDDPDGLATAINDHGLVVGGSGDCATGNTSSLHALLWQNGTATNLGSFGGPLYNIALGINDHGQVTGGSDLPGDTNFFAGPVSTAHAFLWQEGVMTDLGTLSGDAQSFGLGINNKGQVVGGFISRAYIWQNGVMTDLNTLVPGPPFSPLYLLAAESINDSGEITGTGLAISGEEHAFLAIPCDEGHADIEDCKNDAGVASAVDTTEAAASVGASTTTVTPGSRGAHVDGMLDRFGVPRFPGRTLPGPGTWRSR